VAIATPSSRSAARPPVAHNVALRVVQQAALLAEEG
jgi:hypothetical protein